MEEKDRGLQASSDMPELTTGAADLSQSPATSQANTDIDEKRHQHESKREQQDARVTDVEKDKEIPRPRRKSVVDNDDASAYSSDSVEHGEPDLEHEEIEDAVSGHELDRQLSRVG